MSYTLKSIEIKEAKASGKKYGKAVFDDGKVVSIFNFPNLTELKAGDDIDGDLTVGEYKGEVSYSIFPFKKASTFAPKGSTFTPKASNIAKTMEVKAQHIEEAQGRRNDAVKLAGTARDATLLTVAMMEHVEKIMEIEELSLQGLRDLMKEEWKKWREWLMTEFDQLPPF